MCHVPDTGGQAQREMLSFHGFALPHRRRRYAHSYDRHLNMSAIEYHVKGSRVGSEHDIGRHVVPITARKVGNDAQSRLWGVCQLYTP